MAESKDYINSGGLSRGAIFNAVDASLKRLDCGYIDLLQIHRFDKDVPIEETMEALHDLVKSGKVRYIGASSMWAHQVSSTFETPKLSALTSKTVRDDAAVRLGPQLDQIHQHAKSLQFPLSRGRARDDRLLQRHRRRTYPLVTALSGYSGKTSERGEDGEECRG